MNFQTVNEIIVVTYTYVVVLPGIHNNSTLGP